MIDLKTLFEQVTMYCDIVGHATTEKYNITIFHQPDTPIYVNVYWHKDKSKIASIEFTIKEDK